MCNQYKIIESFFAVFKILCLFYTFSTSQFELISFQMFDNHMWLWLSYWTVPLQTLMLRTLWRARQIQPSVIHSSYSNREKSLIQVFVNTMKAIKQKCQARGSASLDYYTQLFSGVGYVQRDLSFLYCFPPLALQLTTYVMILGKLVNHSLLDSDLNYPSQQLDSEEPPLKNKTKNWHLVILGTLPYCFP